MNRIAVIDNGVVNGIIKNVDNIPQIDFSENKCCGLNVDNEKINHGTVCAGIIKKYALDANIISIKIMSNDVRNGTIEPVIQAITFCIEQKIKLINVSLGTCHPLAIVKLGKVVKEAVENDIVIVASGDGNRSVYPASYEGVIHCRTKMRYIPMDDSCYLETLTNGKNIIVSSGAQVLHLYNGKDMITPNYSSFSTPVVTSVIWRKMQQNGADLFRVNEFLSTLIKNGNGNFRFV